MFSVISLSSSTTFNAVLNASSFSSPNEKPKDVGVSNSPSLLDLCPPTLHFLGKVSCCYTTVERPIFTIIIDETNPQKAIITTTKPPLRLPSRELPTVIMTP